MTDHFHILQSFCTRTLNNVTKFGEPVVNKGCSANDMCWFCDANDLCAACDVVDMCIMSDT
ncbi:freyrasin family ranthipeptide [Bacillus cereus]|uniref:freyrasin family ranthipeptide n=1 Tax=Bacillus cereus TaxID=1396 RepID=UPI001482F338